MGDVPELVSSGSSAQGPATLVENSVWQVVARCPALLKQAEIGLAALTEVTQLLTAVSAAQNVFGTTVIKALAKRARALEAAMAGEASTVNRMIHKLKDSAVHEAAAFEVEAKYVSETVVPAINKIVSTKQAIRQTLINEHERKRKEIESQKEMLEKRRKDCVKQHTYLHELMKKILEGRQLMMKENDPTKKEKLNQSVDKVEKTLFNHKQVVRKMFGEVEKYCDQVNVNARAFYEGDTVILMEKLRALEIERNDELKVIMEKYIGHSKNTLQQAVNAKSALEESIAAIFSSQDASMYTETQLPAQWEHPPPVYKPDLPCSSDDVEKQADGILKAGIALGMMSKTAAPAPPSSANSNQTPPAASANPTPTALSATGFFAKGLVAPLSLFGMAGSSSEYEEKKVDHVPDSHLANNHESASTQPPPASPTPTKVVAIYDYEHEEGSPDYLKFKEGDYVIVTDQSDAYWWAGYLETDGSKAEKWFPVEYVDYI
jgi:hypothetical protein